MSTRLKTVWATILIMSMAGGVAAQTTPGQNEDEAGVSLSAETSENLSNAQGEKSSLAEQPTKAKLQQDKTSNVSASSISSSLQIITSGEASQTTLRAESASSVGSSQQSNAGSNPTMVLSSAGMAPSPAALTATSSSLSNEQSSNGAVVNDTSDEVSRNLIAEEALAQDAASSRDRTDGVETVWLLVKVIGGLTILFGLAFLGGHPRVERLEQQLGITHVVTAGFPFVALGLVAALPSVGILSDRILNDLEPVMNFGLGWLGFAIGMQIDMRFLDKLPKGTAFIVVIEALMPFVVIAVACGALMMALGQNLSDAGFARDAIILAAAGAMTAPIFLEGQKQFSQAIAQGWHAGAGLNKLISQLDEIAGIVGLLFLAAYFRPEGAGVSWNLPGTGWVFVTIGLGVTIGVVMYIMLKAPRSNAENLAVVLGFVAFGAGLAGYLHLSSIVVCFVAGVLLTNFPGQVRTNLMPILSRLERPIYMTFLIIVGAVWQVGDWRGWLLLPCFVLARFLGSWAGVVLGKRAELDSKRIAQISADPAESRQFEKIASSGSIKSLLDERGHRALVAPLSALSIAIVVNVNTLYAGQGDNTASWLMTAVIGGAIVTEVIVQFLQTPEFRSAYSSTNISSELPDESYWTSDSEEGSNASRGEEALARAGAADGDIDLGLTTQNTDAPGVVKSVVEDQASTVKERVDYPATSPSFDDDHQTQGPRTPPQETDEDDFGPVKGNVQFFDEDHKTMPPLQGDTKKPSFEDEKTTISDSARDKDSDS